MLSHAESMQLAPNPINKVYPTSTYSTISTPHQTFLPVNRRFLSDRPFFDTRFDADSSIFWLSLRPDCPAKFTPELVQAFRDFQRNFSSNYDEIEVSTIGSTQPKYLVLTSEIEGAFNLGGDLSHFYSLIKSGNRDGLKEYARASVELVYQNHIAMGMPMTTIALLKGDAMGGGMEAAISANVLIAEKQVKMGLPEVLFNMFPGMGAYQFLSRRLSPVAAEKMILSGKTYEAEELYEMGVIDILADEDRGEEAVIDYVRRQKRHDHAARALRSAIRTADPVSRESLMSVVDIWVDTAMGLSDMDLSRMMYLIRAQARRGF